MSSLRDYIGPGGRMLARRLDHLCSTLESLGVRLRDTIADAMGETIGSIIRDTALHVLDNVTHHLPVHAPLPHPGARIGREALDDRGYWPDYEEDVPERGDENQPVEPASERLPAALSAGLQAASWWLKRWTGQGRLWSAFFAGIVATGVAYAGGPITTLLLSLANSVTQLTSLAEAVGQRESEPSYFDPR
jgi:hypothetical protein